jgi:hypothetical protein
MGREMIAKANPVVKGEKLNKIWKGYCCNFRVWLFVSYQQKKRKNCSDDLGLGFWNCCYFVVIISCYVLILVK